MAAVGLFDVLGVDAVQGGDAGFVVSVAADEGAEVYVRGPRVGHRGEPLLAEQV